MSEAQVVGQTVSEDERSLKARLRWVHALAVLFALLALVPLLAGTAPIRESPSVNNVLANMLVPAVALYLGTVLCKARPGLFGVILVGGLLTYLTGYAAVDGMGDVFYAGWPPVYWSALLGVVQLALLVAAARAFLVAPGGTAGRYVLALAGAHAPLFLWAFLAPMHGWAGHGMTRNDNNARGYIRSAVSCLATHAESFEGTFPRTLDEPALRDFGCADIEAGLRRYGYQVTYTPGPPDASGRFRSFRLTARPLRHGRTGMHSYLADESGAIRRTLEPREARPSDDLLQ